MGSSGGAVRRGEIAITVARPRVRVRSGTRALGVLHNFRNHGAMTPTTSPTTSPSLLTVFRGLVQRWDAPRESASWLTAREARGACDSELLRAAARARCRAATKCVT